MRTEIVEADWLTRMVELAQLPGVGVVGAKLLYADGSVQHGGVSVAAGAIFAWHTCLGMPPDAPGLDGELLVPRDCAAVTGACMLVERALFERLDGFDEIFPLDLGDTDLCLRVRAVGRRVVFTPQATVIHHESATRESVGGHGAPELFAARWGQPYAEGDPVEHPSFAPGLSFRVVDDVARADSLTALLRTTDIDLSTPRLECPGLPADDAGFFVGNELRLYGWAVGATGPAAVAATIDGQAVPVVTDVESPAGADGRPGSTEAEKAGFEIRVDMSAWERGAHEICIVARDGLGGETSRTGTLDVLPHRIAPTSLSRMVADIADGRPVLFCDKPTLDGSYEAGDRFAVHGWAYALSGIEAVLVSLDGRSRQPAEYGRRRADLIESVHPEAGNAGFELHVDISDVEDGEHRLTVVAVARDGQAVGVEGPIRARHRKRPQSRSLGPNGKPDIPERFVPEEFRGHLIDAEHQARYRWAARLARDADVLDAACGVGYGAAILAEADARRVVGIDRDAEAILNARARAGEVAEFLLGDLRTLPFEEGSFDLVACFEAIEHVVEQDAVLDELRRVLRQDGILLISSPNRETFMPGNPHHVHEYTPDELQAALGRRFANVRLHGQHAHLASLLAGDETFAAEDGNAPVPAEVRKLSATPAKLYTVAAASDAELPMVDDIVTLGGVFEVRQLFEYAWAWEERAIAAEADAAANRAELKIAQLARKRVERLVEPVQAQLEAVRTSKSWTLTAPLRQAAEVVRRRRLR